MAEPSSQTLTARRARISERREAWRERDAARYRLAGELAQEATIAIPAETGYVLLPPGAVPLADEVVSAANDLVDRIGHAELVARATKDDFMAQGFLPGEAVALGSPYFRFALSEPVVAAVAAYLGILPVLNLVDVWYSFHGGETPKSSQRWHLDSADTTQVKVWIHCSDVGAASGPLTVLDATRSEELAERIGYDFGERHRIPDEHVRELVGSGAVALEGPAGTVHFVDTSRCFHFGSRVAEGATPRRVFVAQFLTPYSFRFKSSHLERARYRELARDADSELERLVLGAA